MVTSSSAATVTISSTAAASLLYIFYHSRKRYQKKGVFDKLSNLDILNQQSSDSDSDLSFEHSQGSSSHFHEHDHDESMRSFIPALPSFGLSWSMSGTKDQEDDDLSFRMDRNARKNSITSDSTGNQPPQQPQCIYLDYNGTTPIDQRVVASMMPFLTTHFGNPSSSHYYGAAPKQAIVKARKSILGLLHPNHISKSRLVEEQDGVIFTGCGTEADNLAIYAAIRSHDKFSSASADASTNTRFGFPINKSKSRHHIVTSNVEHPAIDQYLKALEKEGKIDVTRVPVKTDGCVEVEDMIQAIRPGETILVTLMLANNESGALQPVKQVAQYCRAHNILFHTDAAQAVGKVSIALDETGIGDCVDMITIVGHKFGAPKGIACLYVRPGCLSEGGRRSELDSSDYLLLGGGQEKGKRAGTENVPYIAAFGTAADILTAKTKYRQIRWKKNAQRMESLRTKLLQNLVEGLGDDVVKPNGPPEACKRLPNTLSVGLRNVQSGELLQEIQMLVACSAGSACHSSGGKLSPVLEAMKVPMEFARGTLRLSVGPDTTQDDVDMAAKIIIKEVKRQLDAL